MKISIQGSRGTNCEEIMKLKVDVFNLKSQVFCLVADMMSIIQ